MEGGEPESALLLVLPYLPLQELLRMSEVSKFFRDGVRNDVLVWLHIVAETPLSMRLTDQILINITSKAHGRLRTLALLNSHKISDHALLQVVTSNPLLTKLYVPGCTGLTPEGVLKAVSTLTAKPNTSISLKMNGIYNIKKEHLLILQSFIPQTSAIKSRFYHKYSSSSFRSIDEDERCIDIELCPKCEDVKLVFDCPTDTDCHRGLSGMNNCKGCLQCIPRCEACGKCISTYDEQEETLCNDDVCQNCWLHLPKCSHCNMPFCPRHAHNQFNCSSSLGFVCQVCQAK